MSERVYEVWVTHRAVTNYRMGGLPPLRHAYNGSGLALCGTFVNKKWHDKFMPDARRACRDCARRAKAGPSKVDEEQTGSARVDPRV
jgi:hypothetical protein